MPRWYAAVLGNLGSRKLQWSRDAQLGEGTAVTLRLTEPHRGRGRTLIADSAFSSVKTFVNLEANSGLYFMGIVKTAHRGYPKEAMKEWVASQPERRTLKVCRSSTPNDRSMHALCWQEKKPKMLISNSGTGPPSTRLRYKRVIVNGVCMETRRVELRVERPRMIELFYERFSSVDVHNHYRQGSLRIDKEWTTRKRAHRVFASIFGMIVTDAHHAYRYNEDDFMQFAARLA